MPPTTTYLPPLGTALRRGNSHRISIRRQSLLSRALSHHQSGGGVAIGNGVTQSTNFIFQREHLFFQCRNLGIALAQKRLGLLVRNGHDGSTTTAVAVFAGSAFVKVGAQAANAGILKYIHFMMMFDNDAMDGEREGKETEML